MEISNIINRIRVRLIRHRYSYETFRFITCTDYTDTDTSINSLDFIIRTSENIHTVHYYL